MVYQSYSIPGKINNNHNNSITNSRFYDFTHIEQFVLKLKPQCNLFNRSNFKTTNPDFFL